MGWRSPHGNGLFLGCMWGHPIVTSTDLRLGGTSAGTVKTIANRSYGLSTGNQPEIARKSTVSHLPPALAPILQIRTGGKYCFHLQTNLVKG